MTHQMTTYRDVIKQQAKQVTRDELSISLRTLRKDITITYRGEGNYLSNRGLFTGV